MADTKRTVLLNSVGKYLAVAGLVVFAGVALLSGSDRQSREFPTSPSVVGWTYDTGAARAKAILAFVNTGPASAIPLARRAILSDPLSAPVVSILGRSQLYAGQLTDAHKTFEVAGQLGWRDGMTQIYWLDQALRSSNYRVAAERVDALLRQTPQDENGNKFLAIVSATPEGRDALANRLKLKPGWAETYVSDLRDLPPDQLVQRVDVLRRSGPGIVDCRIASRLAQQLINHQMLEDAQSLWQMECPSSTSLIYDGNFELLDTTASTYGFGWQLSNRGDAEVSLEQGTGGHPQLTLAVNASVSLPIVRQLVVLKPGTYRLSWRMPDTGASAAQALRASLSCDADFADAVQGSPDPSRAGFYFHDFNIDGQCTGQQLIFWLAPNEQIHLAKVMLARF